MIVWMYTELLWTTAQKGPSMEARKWLNVLKMSELMAIARESGVQPEQLDDALDEDSPRSVILGLMSKQGGVTRGFMQDWSELSDAQIGAADALGLSPECFHSLLMDSPATAPKAVADQVTELDQAD